MDAFVLVVHRPMAGFIIFLDVCYYIWHTAKKQNIITTSAWIFDSSFLLPLPKTVQNAISMSRLVTVALLESAVNYYVFINIITSRAAGSRVRVLGRVCAVFCGDSIKTALHDVIGTLWNPAVAPARPLQRALICYDSVAVTLCVPRNLCCGKCCKSNYRTLHQHLAGFEIFVMHTHGPCKFSLIFYAYSHSDNICSVCLMLIIRQFQLKYLEYILVRRAACCSQFTAKFDCNILCKSSTSRYFCCEYHI